jgi:heme oxygenase
MRRLLSADLTCEEYGCILLALYRCYALLEPALDGCRRWMEPDVPSWMIPAIYRRTPNLIADLRALAVPLPEDDTLNSLTTSLSTQAAVAGVMYVLAGSTLGGRVIVTAVSQHLPRPQNLATTFFKASEVNASMHWPDYRRMLERVLTDERAEADAVKTARQTFEMFLCCIRSGNGSGRHATVCSGG